MTSFLLLRDRGVDDALRLGDGFGERLLAEDVAARVDGRSRIGPVRFRVRVDADDIGLGRGQRGIVVAELGHAAQLLAERAARGRATADHAGDLELGHLVIGAGVAGAHVAAAGNEHSQGTGHRNPSRTAVNESDHRSTLSAQPCRGQDCA